MIFLHNPVQHIIYLDHLLCDLMTIYDAKQIHLNEIMGGAVVCFKYNFQIYNVRSQSLQQQILATSS